MPRLPDVNDLGARPVPQSRRNVVSVRNAGAMGEGLSQIGRTVAGVGEQVMEREDRLTYAAAKSKLLEADINARRELDKDNDFETYESRYQERMKRAREEAAKTIRSKSDRAAFELDANDSIMRGGASISQAARQKRTQHRVAIGQESLATLSRAGLDAPDEATRTATIKTADDIVRGLVETGDLNEVEAGNLSRQWKENYVLAQIQSRLQLNDFPGAKKLFEQQRGMLSAESILKTDKIIREQDAVWTAMGVATEAIAGAVPRMFPTDFGRMVEITMQTESGGRRFGNDGKVLTSPKGARGEMQVMPGTERDPGFGVRPMANDSHDERARVGRDYLAAMLKRYADPAMAWAAYNAGPGAVDAAVKKSGADWLSAMPGETQDYVARNMRQLATGGGRPATPTLLEVQARVRSDPRLQGNPIAMKAALAQVEAQFKDAIDTRKMVEDEAVSTAMQWIDANGGRVSEMPMQLRSAVPSEKLDEVLSYAERIAKGDDITDPAVFLKLTSDSKYLAGLSDQAFYRLRARLSDSDFQSFAKERAELRDGGGAKSPETIDRGAFNAVMANRLQSLGIAPSQASSAKKAETTQRAALITAHVRKGLLAEQEKAGRKFTEAEIERYVDEQFARSVNVQTTGFFGGKGIENRQLLSMTAKDVPQDVRRRIEEGLKARGVEATDGLILGAYWEYRRRRGG